MRILQLCLSNSLGGLELYFLNCCLHFKNHDAFTLFALTRKNSPLYQKLAENKLDSILLKKQTGKFPLLEAIKLYKKIESLKINAIHIHCKKDLPLGVLLKKLSGGKIKLVHTRQMNMPHVKKDPFHNFQYKSIDLILSITEKLRYDILNNTAATPQKTKTFYYGIKTPSENWQSRFNTFKQKHENKDQKALRIAVFGNLNSKKSQHTIIKALGMIHEDLPQPWHLYLVGSFIENDYETKIKNYIAEAKIQDNVILTGFEENAKDLMPGFDIIVLTTEGETFGLVLAEAMKANVAVIGTNSEGVPEIIDHGETGYLYTPGDYKDLSSYLLLLAKDEQERKKIADAGKLKADKLFDHNTHFEKLNEYFQSL
jgi:glycosyltransferase involved in cell wall biosynthesis